MNPNNKSIRRARYQSGTRFAPAGLAERPLAGSHEQLVHRVGLLVRPQADGCWIWTGRTDRAGYGVTPNGQSAHRFVYSTLVADPGVLVLHHECQVRACVNPAHLVPMTRSEHVALHASDTCSDR